MSITPITLGILPEVVNLFQIWRAKQNSVFSPIPTHLRVQIRQLIESYPVSQIATALNISKATIYSIKNEQPHDAVKRHNHLTESSDDPEQNLNFIPFKLLNTTESLSQTPLAPCCTCQIIKPNGVKLVITTPDPTNVIKAFLCSN
jgi:hypothetical protein